MDQQTGSLVIGLAKLAGGITLLSVALLAGALLVSTAVAALV